MADQSQTTEVPVNFTNWVELFKGGPIYVAREQPRPPGGVDGRGYGADVGVGETYFPEGQ